MSTLDRRGRPTLALVGQSARERFYVELARRAGGPVLLLGCPSPSFAIHLCGEVPSVIAVDPSEALVAAAEENRAREPADVGDRLRLVTADLRAVRLPERFSVVFAPLNSIGLMTSADDLDALLVTARTHLSPAGTFALDTMNPQAGIAGASGVLRETPSIATGRAVFAPHLHERRRALPHGEETSLRRLRLRQFSADELDAALSRARLLPLERYGNFEEKPFDGADALQVVIALGA